MTRMTGATSVARQAAARRQKVLALVAAVCCVVLSVVVVHAITTRTAPSAWQAIPTQPGEVVVAELSGQDDDFGYDFWVRQVEAPNLTGPLLTASYVDRMTRAGWALLQSYPAPDGPGFNRVCLATSADGEPRLADIRSGSASASQLLDRVEIAVSRRTAERSMCGDVFGQYTWAEASKPTG